MTVAVVAILVVVGIAAALAALTGVFGGSDEESSTDPDARRGSTSRESDAPTTEPAEELIPGETIGTPENPYSPGDTVVIEDWTFTLGETDTDSWPELVIEIKKTFPTLFDDFAPEPGMVYVTAPLTFTYTGPPETQNRANGFDVVHFGTDGTETQDGRCGEYSSSSGDRFDSTSIWRESSEEGVVCAQLSPERAEGGQWQLALFFWDHEGKDRLIDVFYTAD